MRLIKFSWSADEHFADLVAGSLSGKFSSEIYATGTLVLFRPAGSVLPPGVRLEDLANLPFGRIAIAHPTNAPYGRATQDVLQDAGMWENLSPKLAIGENVAQAAQFAATGNVDVAFISLSHAKALRDRGDWRIVPTDQTQNLRHKMVLLDLECEAALAMSEFLLSEAASQVWRAHGFEPGGN